MKSAFVSAAKAFVATFRQNKFELAKKTVEKNGYVVSLPVVVKKTK